jgi:hypothetical protein
MEQVSLYSKPDKGNRMMPQTKESSWQTGDTPELMHLDDEFYDSSASKMKVNYFKFDLHTDALQDGIYVSNDKKNDYEIECGNFHPLAAKSVTSHPGRST